MNKITLLVITSIQFINIYVKADVYDLENKRELFVDQRLIEKLDGVEMRLSTPIPSGPVHKFDKPWEGPFSGYSTVIKDNDNYFLYYLSLIHI